MNDDPLKLTKIEQLKELYLHIKDSNRLYLSPNIKFKHLGGNWDIIQFICTWQKQHKETEILLGDAVNIEAINNQDEILLIAFYITNKTIYKNKNIKTYLLKKFIPFVESINNNNPTFKKPLICLGGAKNEFIKIFYSQEKFKHKADITPALKALFWSHYKNKESYSKHIIEIMYELISNTDKHARLDVDGNDIPNSIRSLSVEYDELSIKTKELFLKQRPHYDKFLSNVDKMFVISIFDNGEGIIKKYIETKGDKKIQNMSLEEKKQAFKDVFDKNTTSSTIPNSGMGLYYVEESITKLGGLLSIKTNSLELLMSPNNDEIIKENNTYGGALITAIIPIN